VEPLLRIEKAQIHLFGHMSRMLHERLARQVQPTKPAEKRFRGYPKPAGSGWMSDLARSRLGVEPAQLFDREVFQVLLGLLPPRPSLEEKRT